MDGSVSTTARTALDAQPLEKRRVHATSEMLCPSDAASSIARAKSKAGLDSATWSAKAASTSTCNASRDVILLTKEGPAHRRIGCSNCRKLDFCQRSVLFLDTLRERANNMLAHEQAGLPPLLHFEYETIFDARRFERPLRRRLSRA